MPADKVIVQKRISTVEIQSTGQKILVEKPQVKLITVGKVGPQGPMGPPGVGASYLHDQGAPSSFWNVIHNLGHKYPSVTVIDSGDNEVHGDVHYVDENHLQIEFSVPFGGKAECKR